MGFIISKDDKYSPEDYFHAYVNFSESARLVFKEDMSNFSNGSKEKDNETGFFNRIFANFYQEADATISQRVAERREKLESLFSSKELEKI